MDINNLKGLMEAYQQVNAPEQLDEVLDTPEKANEYARKNVRSMLGAFAKGVANKDISQLKTAELGKRKAERKAAEEQKESFDIFDVVLEFLQVNGYAETLEEAEWMMANLIDEEAVAIILGEENVNEIFGLGGRSAKDRLANSDYMKKKNKEADEKAIQNLRDMMSKDPERQKRPSRINNESFKAWLDEAMSNYEKNRKRAAQRAAARNAARDQGKTGAVPGVGYVTPGRERETWTDESGKTRHAKGL
jgi:hypothetical protein